MMNHLSLVKWQIQLLSPFPAVAFDRIESFDVKLGRCSERWERICHVKHRVVPHRPGADLFVAGAVDEDGMALVDAAGDVGVAAGAEDGGGAGVGVDAGEVGGSKGEAAIRVVDGGGVVEEEGALGSAKRRSSPPKMRAQNLKEESTSGKKKIFRGGGSRSRTGRQFVRRWIRT